MVAYAQEWDQAAEQLKAFIELQSKQAKLAAPLIKLAGYDIDASLPLDDPVVWVSSARHALTLDNKNETNALLKRAFREFDLDPDNPFDWRRLLAWAAFFLFAAKKQSGRPTEWDAKRYCELLEAVDRRKQRNPTCLIARPARPLRVTRPALTFSGKLELKASARRWDGRDR